MPRCRLKLATMGRRLLCAAADVSSLLVHLQRQPPGGSVFLAPANMACRGYFFGGGVSSAKQIRRHRAAPTRLAGRVLARTAPAGDHPSRQVVNRAHSLAAA